MRILNFGSLNIDYVYNVDHFVQKGETISASMLNVYAGGKGLNQSIALSRAGAEVWHAGAVGKDGAFLLELLKKEKVDTAFIKILADVQTGNAVIQNDCQGENCIILYGGANRSINQPMVDEVLNEFGENDYLILQNEISEVPYMAEQAHNKGMRVGLNPSPLDEKIFKINFDCIDCLILNEIEALSLVAGTSDKEEKKLLEAVTEYFPQAEIVMTLGEKGALAVKAGEIFRQEAYRVQAVDTTAAGDTFTGYYLAERLQGSGINESLAIAAQASAIAVSRKGAAPSIPLKEEVLNF